MPIKEREDHFTIAQVAKDLRLDIEQVEQLITKGALRMAVPSAEVEEISSLSDPLQSTAWYGRADPLDHLLMLRDSIYLSRIEETSISLRPNGG